MRDAVVVGSGHNALIAACYLARAGLDVEVVERDTVPGGAVSTVERFGGYLMDRGSSAHIMIRHTGIVEELRLDRCGLDYQDLDPWGFAPFWTPGGEQVALTFYRDLDLTCASIERVCGAADADAYRAFAVEWGDRNERVFAAFGHPPTAGRLGRALWGIGRRGAGADTAREFLAPADWLLDRYFTDERLKTALAWMGAQSGPPTHEVATADLVGWVPMMHRRAPGHPRGGSGALTQALARRLASAGGTLRLGDGARRILATGGRAAGVLTDSGERIAARVVVAGCHVLTTARLLGDALPAHLAERMRGIRVGAGVGMAVRLGTTDLPRYPAAGPDSHRAMQLLAPSRLALRTAYGDYLAGRPPRRPAALAMTFSAFDDSLAPPGRHNVTVWGQWHPYALASGERWDDVGRRAADLLIEQVDAAAPGFAGSVRHVFVQTPADLEAELGLLGGNVMHVEMGLDAMFSLRPLPELAGYRVPGVRGLYLTGASTHPGGGVFGASGRSAARVVLRDWSRDRDGGRGTRGRVRRWPRIAGGSR
ncbi:MAG TPA: NAD(P)/FAD-dependent oxidoreductase [Mycobacteriales bacterium]|nr:NAD(P)/FAD-dependent oxidoreductase [Mycobacteriales bacterium]